MANLKRNELIAAAILLVVLLLGLRAPIAALLVTAVGTISMLAGFGEVALLGHVLRLDPVGVAAGTMTGLALGVGFALLILDRFHRELGRGALSRDSADAAARELQTTGKAVLVGGTALVLALAVVALIGPTQLMVSVGTGRADMCSVRDRRRRRGHARCAGAARKANRRAELPRPRVAHTSMVGHWSTAEIGSFAMRSTPALSARRCSRPWRCRRSR